MTNIQRICEAAILSGVYTPEEIQQMLENDIEIPLHTKSRWRKKGMKVREGAEGITTKLWLKKGKEDKYYLVDVILYSEDMVDTYEVKNKIT